jgi:hypothetical protein
LNFNTVNEESSVLTQIATLILLLLTTYHLIKSKQAVNIK